MQSKNYAKNTIDCYSYYLKLFLEHTDKPRTKITSSDVKRYINEISCCSSTVKNQTINSIKLYFKYILEKKLETISIERPRKNKRLPRVIDWSKLEVQFKSINNLKHRAILELACRCALRVSEVCNLLISDVDSDRMLILIRDSKFNKDRYVPMSESLLSLLRKYFKQYRPTEYLFNGQFSNKYSVSSCQKIFKKYIDIDKSFHTCRHSGLTQMLNNGINLRTIQNIAGHKSSRTTEIYTHVSNELIAEAAL
jgi:site-specific recombinase XerD